VRKHPDVKACRGREGISSELGHWIEISGQLLTLVVFTQVKDVLVPTERTLAGP
jgi:hypothetical protein